MSRLARGKEQLRVQLAQPSANRPPCGATSPPDGAALEIL
jgi:hypothetical protein